MSPRHPLKTSAFQLLDTEGSHRRRLSLLEQPVIGPLLFHPISQLDVSAISLRNTAVPMDCVMVCKFTAQTVFPGEGEAVADRFRGLPFETQTFHFLDTGERPKRSFLL
jgi:hypothetical protein